MAQVIHPYAKAGRGFVYPEYSSNYPPVYDYRVSHYLLEVEVDLFKRKLNGVAKINVENDKEKWIELDACELEVKEVKVDGNEARWSYDGSKLKVLAKRGRSEITVRYSASPRKGFHFVLPDKANPNRRPQAWSQGETEYNRYWMPLPDHPSIKFTSELIAKVPRGFKAVSNGDLLGARNEGELTIWHWKMDRPHSGYLISLVVGDFEEIVEGWDGVKLFYYVPHEWKEKYRLSFSKTPEILKFFSEYLNYPYPFKKYAQVTVAEFIFGGMENTTATTLTESTLHDELAHVDFSSDPLVAHEAAHQWFGDLVTCKDWSHIWINESMATFLENLFVRHDKGEDEFVYELIRDMDSYLEEYKDKYARPIVMRVYKYPTELFDSHSYPKGGLIVNMLRAYLGEETFRRGLNLFLKRYAYGVADTDDFRKAMEEVSGKNLELFFEQFFLNAGHPSLKVQEKWDPNRRQLVVSIKQTQGDDSLNVYWLPLRIEIKTPSERRVLELELREREETLVFELGEEPKYVCVDPKFEVFKTLEYERTAEKWTSVLLDDEHVYCRVLAARALGKLGGAKAVEALAEAMLHDGFWGVSAEAARALGSITTDSALEALLRGLREVKHPKVRRAICEALGNFKEERAADALREVLTNANESYYVRQAAAVSIGKTRQEKFREQLISVIDVPSHNYAITVGVIRGLAELGGEESLKVIVKYSADDEPTPVRAAAITSLGKFPGRREVLELLRTYAKSENYRVRQAVIAACRELMVPEVIPILSLLLDDVYEMNRRSARDAIEKVRAHTEKGTEYKALREEVEKLREENRRLLEKVSLLSKTVESKG